MTGAAGSSSAGAAALGDGNWRDTASGASLFPVGRGGGQRGGQAGPRGSWEWWNDREIRKEIGLSEEKARRIDELFAAQSARLRPVADEYQRERALLSRLVAERVVDPGGYEFQVWKTEQFRAKLNESRTILFYRAYLMLDMAQYRTLRGILDRRPTPATSGWEWWNDDGARKALGLTEAKARKIDGLWQRRSRLLKPLVDAFEHEQGEQRRLLVERTATADAYALQVGKTEDLRSRLNESRSVLLYQIYLELTPDQFRKFRDMQERRSGRGRGGSRRLL